MCLRAVVFATIVTVASASPLVAQAATLGVTASATVSAGIGNGLQNNSGLASTTASATATSPCLPFGVPCTGANTASANASVSGNNINLLNQVTVGQTTVPINGDFNTAEAISAGGYNDVISFLHFDAISGQLNAIQVTGGRIVIQNLISGNYQFKQTGMQLNETLTIPIANGGTTGGSFSLFWNGTGYNTDQQSTIDGNIFTSLITTVPVSNYTDMALSVSASLNTLITGDTSCCSQAATFSDPITFEVLDSNGNVIPDLVAQSELGFQYSVVDGANLTATPICATLPLFASGLGALGLLGWRRKRKAQAAAALPSFS